MSSFDTVFEQWVAALEKEKRSYWWSLLSSKKLQKCHYMGYLRETYHYTKINPQTQAYATMFIGKYNHKFVRDFLKHSMEEITHDQLALDDLECLGIDRNSIVKSQPLPMTTAFSGIPFYLMQFENPLSYLGHIFHLEFLATQNGESFMNQLNALDIPKEALSFIFDHAKIDPKHNEKMVWYINSLGTSKSDVDAIIYGAEVACRAYSTMVSEACIFGEQEFAK